MWDLRDKHALIVLRLANFDELFSQYHRSLGKYFFSHIIVLLLVNSS